MKIFISYSTAIDQIVALRLQTLATVYGLTSYVPPATTRQTANPELSDEVQRKLQESDVVLAVMMHNPALSAVSENEFGSRDREAADPHREPDGVTRAIRWIQPALCIESLRSLAD